MLRYDNWFDHQKDGKFLHKWEGPFLILKKYDNGSYLLQDLSGKVHRTRVNGWRLKPYIQRDEVHDYEGLQNDEELGTLFEPEFDGLGA